MDHLILIRFLLIFRLQNDIRSIYAVRNILIKKSVGGDILHPIWMQQLTVEHRVLTRTKHKTFETKPATKIKRDLDWELAKMTHSSF